MFLKNPVPDQVVVLCPGPNDAAPDGPAALVHVNGFPFLGHVLANVKRNGLSDVILVTGAMGDKIEAAFGDGRRYGLRIRYFHDPEDNHGHGGALRGLENQLHRAFFILDGSRYLLVDLAPLGGAFVAAGLPFLMAVWENADPEQPSSCLLMEDERGRLIVSRYHAGGRPGMYHCEYGAVVCRDDIVDMLPGDYSTLDGVYQGNALRKRIAALEVRQRYYHVQTGPGLRELRAALLSGAAPTYVHLLEGR